MFQCVGLFGLKGGVGRSTVSLNLGGAFVERGYHVVIVDLDPQRSLEAVRRDDGARIVYGRDAFEQGDPGTAINDLAGAGADLVLLDGPPWLDRVSRALLAVSDLVVVPCTPSAFDVRATRRAMALIQEAREAGVDVHAVALRNRMTRTLIAGELGEALRMFGMDVLQAQLGARTDFQASSLEGVPVVELAPRSKAADEIRQLASEIEALGLWNDHEEGIEEEEEAAAEEEEETGPGQRGVGLCRRRLGNDTGPAEKAHADRAPSG